VVQIRSVKDQFLSSRLTPGQGRIALPHASGHGRVIEVRRNSVPDGGFVLIFSDITERKRSDAEIDAARDAAEAAYRDLKAAQANLIQAEKMASLGQLTEEMAWKFGLQLDQTTPAGSPSRLQLLARLTLNSGKHTANQPTRLAHLDDGK
jgi:hypothetical protein